MDIFDLYNSIEWRTWDTLHAIHSLKRFHEENEKQLKESAEVEVLLDIDVQEAKKAGDADEIAMHERVARHFHDDVMLPHLRYSSIVMLFVIFERELKRLIANIEKERGDKGLKHSDLKGGLITQAKTYLRAMYGISIDSPRLQKIHDLQKVRDCITHCHGDIRLSRDKEFLKKYCEQTEGISANLGDELVLENSYVFTAINSVFLFYKDIFQLLGWKIEKRWDKASD